MRRIRGEICDWNGRHFMVTRYGTRCMEEKEEDELNEDEHGQKLQNSVDSCDDKQALTRME